MKQYEIFELAYHCPAPESDFVHVDLVAEFVYGEHTTKVFGFYAGEGIYKLRFLPLYPGKYTYRVSGCISCCGEVVCEPADTNRHGPVYADGVNFKTADGQWFYPFGTTIYALVHQEASLIQQTLETLRTAPFNKVRTCVFPKHYIYNENEPQCFPFEKKADGSWDTTHPVFEFWDNLEVQIQNLDNLGIQCDLILFHPYDCWGLSKFPMEDALTYLNYLIRRLAAFPNIWWSLANEYELLGMYSQEDWQTFAAFIGARDPYRHLLSCHNVLKEWDCADPHISHASLQSNRLMEVSQKIAKNGKPVVVDECRYEGNIPLDWGNISAFELVHRFWTVCVQGGYCSHGETYINDRNILWWSKGGQLVGESPERIRFLRKIVEILPGPIMYAGRDFGPEMLEGLKQAVAANMPLTPFMKLLASAEPQIALDHLTSSKELIGHCDDEVYLKYYGRNCSSVGELDLPTEHHYQIDVIDVWEMTVTTVLENAIGSVKIPLPGKEGIAVLATRQGSTHSLRQNNS